MEFSSRQIVALGAPLVVAYLTWSALGEQAKTTQQFAGGAAIGTATAAQRPEFDTPARNPFAPIGDDGLVDTLDDDAGGREEEAADAPLHLDGTAIAGTWRMAIINGERVFEGQDFRGRFRLSQVGTDSVTLTAPSGEMVRLSLDIARPVAAAKAGAGGAKAPVAAALERGMSALKGATEAGLVAEGAGAPKR
jgi:hypothetical protein